MGIKYLFMDVDGTLTDGKIYMGPDSEVMKAFDIKDGCGISIILRRRGITPVIITGRTSAIVENRCRELGIDTLYQGVAEKRGVLEKLLGQLKASKAESAYIGDDINDLPAMRCLKEGGGLIGCPADAADAVKEVSDYVASHKGGDGAVRDFIEWLVDDGGR